MSHQIKARTKLTEETYLLKALDKLNFPYSKTITGNIDLGYSKQVHLEQQQDGSWLVTGDPYYDKGILNKYYNKTDKLIADLQTYYNVGMAQDKLCEMGYYCIENQEGIVNDEGIIEMVFDNGM